jgi:Ca2+-binding RTX toxin-like protein
MMKITAQKIKTTDFSDLQPEATGQAQADNGVDTSDLAAAIAEIEQFEQENSEWLSEENLSEMDRIKTMLVAEKAAIENFGPYGSGGAGAGGVDPTLWEMPQALDAYWNGVNPDQILQSDDDASRLDEDPAWYGDYMGTVQVLNSGDPANPTNVGFQMTEDMVGIWGESRGSDIVVTVEYTDGRRESWVVEGGSVRAEPMIVSGIGLEGVVMDFSRVFRQNGDLYLHGSDGDDEIKGSQSGCGIIAYAGDDMIWGGAGDDRIYGDEHYLYAGQFDPSYGGADTVYGGAGNDILYGGGGIDTNYSSDAGESINEFDTDPINDLTTTPPDPASWSSSDVWEYNFDESQDGTLIFRNQSTEGFGGDININMDGMPGYDMAFGDMDADGALVITFVGEEGSFKVKYEDFFSDQFGADNPMDRIVKLNLYGTSGNDIINFDKIQVTSQVINLLGGAGEDIILGTHNKLLMDGLKPDSLDRSQKNGAGVLAGHVNEGIFAADDENQYGKDSDGKVDLAQWNGYKATAEDGQISISDDGNAETTAGEVLCLKAPDGYTHGYITQDPSTGDTIVIMVKPQASGDAKTIVVRIDESLGLGYNDILVKNEVTTIVGDGDVEQSSMGAPFTLTAISLDPNDYVIEGGAGKDLIFAPEGTKVVGDDNEEVVWEEEFNTLPTPPPSAPTQDTDPIAPVEDSGSESDSIDDSGGDDGSQTV